jgi:hypothetical protein
MQGPGDQEADVGSDGVQVEANEVEVNDDDEGSEGGQAHGDVKRSVAVQWSNHHGQMWRGGDDLLDGLHFVRCLSCRHF